MRQSAFLEQGLRPSCCQRALPWLPSDRRIEYQTTTNQYGHRKLPYAKAPEFLEIMWFAMGLLQVDQHGFPIRILGQFPVTLLRLQLTAWHTWWAQVFHQGPARMPWLFSPIDMCETSGNPPQNGQTYQNKSIYFIIGSVLPTSHGLRPSGKNHPSYVLDMFMLSQCYHDGSIWMCKQVFCEQKSLAATARIYHEGLYAAIRFQTPFGLV